VGYYFGAITLLYGITLGLLMVGDWTTLTETQEKVDREASTLAAFYLDVSRYPEPHRGRLQNDLRSYTREVIDVAWPQQQKGIVPKGNVANVAAIANDLAAFEPASEEQKTLTPGDLRQVQRTRGATKVPAVGRDGRPFRCLVGARLPRGGDHHGRHVVLSPAQPKNAHLDDGLDVLVARANDLPPLGNGSSVSRADIGVYATFSAYLR
jgi:hypothetical protein